jgi:predicted Fe-Mo cluster-binding NifX family protein
MGEIKRKQETSKETIMRIAIPVVDGKLSAHFGHCEGFALVDTDNDSKVILKMDVVTAPPHEPGLLPKWLAEKGADMIIAGGIGGRALGLFQAQSINVLTGAPSETPETIVTSYLAGTLTTGVNVCDH